MADPFLDLFDPNASVPIFGTRPTTRGVYPNDGITLDVYNYTNDYLESNYRLDTFGLGSFEVSIDLEQQLRNMQYYSGKYNAVARFFRNYLGSGDGDKLVIEEVSSDRFEIRVTPRLLLDNADNNLLEFFEQNFFEIDKEQVLPNLYVFKSAFESVKVFDYVQDPFTFDSPPFSIIFKLGAPLPLSVQVGDVVWIAQEVSEPIRDAVTVIPVAPDDGLLYLAGPNFDALSQYNTSIGTDYRSWNEVLTTGSLNVQNLVNRLFSGSMIEGIELNADFRRFENFIHFGSAEERLRNFEYKLQLLENYDSQIGAINAANLAAPNASYENNLQALRAKRGALLGGFDSYEKYLYFESSSYELSTFGEFYPSTWPKQNNAKPYINYSVTSSEGQAWFTQMVTSASQYDIDNVNALRKFIPFHIYENPANEQYLLFVDMIGHYFDLIFTYIHQITHINKRYESLLEGYARDLVYSVAQSFGLNAENGFAMQELWSYFLGTDEAGTFAYPSSASLEDTSKEAWKRIVTNLPYLLKTKGTARGIRALINCYGIPSTILKVREFGGAEPGWNTVSYDVYDQFFYGLRVHPGLSVSLGGAGNGAIELRFRISESILNNNANYSVGSLVSFNPGLNTATINGSTLSVPFSPGDVDWWSVNINAAGNSYLGANRFGEPLIFEFPAGGVSPNQNISGPFEGFISEFRTYTDPLEEIIFKQHLMAPTSYVGPLNGQLVGSTSAFDKLKVRFPLGGDSKKIDFSNPPSSVHPNQDIVAGSVSFTGYDPNRQDDYLEPQVETHYLSVVDGGPSREIGAKIRIDDTVLLSSNELYRDNTILWSVQDLQPVDSPRVGVYFSPNSEVNEDISEQFGGLNLDNYIGAPWAYYQNDYPELKQLRREYIKKYTKRNDVQGFARLIHNYDASLFQLVKQFVAERALLHTGLVYESDVLHRIRIATEEPSYEELYWEGDIDLPDPEPYAENAVIEGEIPEVAKTPSAEMDDINGAVNATNHTALLVLAEELIEGKLNGAQQQDPVEGEAELIEGEADAGLSNATNVLNDPYIHNQTMSTIYKAEVDALSGLGNFNGYPAGVNLKALLQGYGAIIPDEASMVKTSGGLKYVFIP